ncbi:unnamed protein product [Cuscuta campestris]|uniref:Uncharacterized protein n=1 Tax=Cuscuta campestris TaxID=132261 RepID=A0A484LW63_9ASTE|nr:unnamed protein product [Cuscuta campestris]
MMYNTPSSMVFEPNNHTQYPCIHVLFVKCVNMLNTGLLWISLEVTIYVNIEIKDIFYDILFCYCIL